jgi:hypothetical protein
VKCGLQIRTSWVWQYGSNEDNFDTKPWILDGIAPQAPIQNIGNNRVFIPDGSDGEEAVYQDFYYSHKIKQYEWIFKKTTTKKGYVAPSE